MKSENLILVLISIAVAVSGCVKGLQDPAPVIVNPEEQNGALDVIGGETTVSADIRNRGYPGDVRIILTVLDSNRTVLGQFDRIVRMGKNETRRISISAEVPEGSKIYRLGVESAD